MNIEPIDYIKLNKNLLAELYNGSDIEAINYMLPFCEGEYKKICERIKDLNERTQLGWGEEDYSSEESNEYYEKKWILLSHFGLRNENGDAIVD